MFAEPYIVGLTGGIGSGKSTVANMFSAFGAAVVDTDIIAHALTTRHGRAIDLIREVMGEDLITPDGSLDRRATRQRVFADNAAKTQLEAILHPLIGEEVDATLATSAATFAPYTLLVVPLLFETQAYRARTRRTLLVDCNVSMQLERVQRRSGLDVEEVWKIVGAQLPRAVKLQLADDVIWNADDRESLGVQTERIHKCYVQQAAMVG